MQLYLFYIKPVTAVAESSGLALSLLISDNLLCRDHEMEGIYCNHPPRDSLMKMQKLATKRSTIILNQADLRDLVGVYRALKDYMERGLSDSEMLQPIFDHYLFVLAAILKRAGYVDLIEIPEQSDSKAQRYLM
jgi:hypothetical protein